MTFYSTTEITKDTEVARRGTVLDYHDIARCQMDTAIQLYNEGNFICATTLAKAGEEFLGKHLGDTCAYKQLKNSLKNEHPDIASKVNLNAIANFLKHGSDLSLCEQEIPIKAEAMTIIFRAITNYLNFTESITKKMSAFTQKHPSEKIDEILKNSVKPL